MGPIHEILAYSQESNNIKKQYESRRIDNKKNETGQIEKTAVLTKNRDSAEISATSINMFNLKTESIQYIKMIRETSTIDDEQIQEIKERILSEYYSKSEVVDMVSKNMASMPNYIAV